MRKQPLIFMVMLALGLTSFAWYESQKPAPIEEALRQKYLSHFDKVELPYRIDVASIEKKSARSLKRLTRDYRDFIPGLAHGEFSRMGPTTYYADVQVASNDNFDVLIYHTDPPYGHKNNYYIQVLDKKGEVIDVENLLYFDLAPSLDETEEKLAENQDFVLITKKLRIEIHLKTGNRDAVTHYSINDEGKIISPAERTQKVKAG